MYDLKTGRRNQRGGQDIARPKGVPLPCTNCPKKSPEHAETLKLSRKNRWIWNLYLKVRATFGRCLSNKQARDLWIGRDLAILETEYEAWRLNRQELSDLTKAKL